MVEIGHYLYFHLFEDKKYYTVNKLFVKFYLFLIGTWHRHFTSGARLILFKKKAS